MFGLIVSLRQIEEKGYETDFLAAGIPKERINKLGFAFSGKDVVVMQKDTKGETL